MPRLACCARAESRSINCRGPPEADGSCETRTLQAPRPFDFAQDRLCRYRNLMGQWEQTRATLSESTFAGMEETSPYQRAPSDSYPLPLIPRPEQRNQSAMTLFVYDSPRPAVAAASGFPGPDNSRSQRRWRAQALRASLFAQSICTRLFLSENRLRLAQPELL